MKEIEFRPGEEWESGELGFFLNVPAKIYHSGPEISHSLTKKARISLRTMRKHMTKEPDEESDDTDAKRFGRVTHLYFEDKDAFNAAVRTLGTCTGKKGDGVPCKNPAIMTCDGVEYCGVHGKDRAPDPIEYMKAEESRWLREWVADLEHPDSTAAHDLYRFDGYHEVSARYRDEPTGLIIRVRYDFLAIDGGLAYVTDYKSARDVTDHGLARAIDEGCYYSQEAVYEDCLRFHGIPIGDFTFLYLGKPRGIDPALCRIDRIDPVAVELGRIEIRGLLDKIAVAVRTGKYPGLDLSRVGSIGLPSWRRFDLEIATKALDAASEKVFHEHELPV